MDLDGVQRSLEARLSQLDSRLAKIESHLRDPGSKDWQERATEVENEEVLEHLAVSERREVDEIRGALARIREGRYAVCAGCGGEIPAARLEALPCTSVCIACAG